MPKVIWISLLYWVLFLSGLSAITRVVDINGSGQFTSIQAAIDASNPGDTVLVYPGRYLESLTVMQRSNLEICSLEALTGDPQYIDSTIIDAQLLSWGMWIKQYCENVIVRGFSFTNCKVGLALSNSVTSVINCKIYENYALNAAGLSISFGTVTLSGVKIYDNYAYRMGGGINIYGYMGTVNVTFDPVNRCSIYNNRAGAGQDIFAHSLNSDLTVPLETFTVPVATEYYASRYVASGDDFQLHIDANNFVHEELDSDLYVSVDGDDTNDGMSPATALKTIGTALYRIAPNSTSSRTVHILPGVYANFSTQEKFPIALKGGVVVKGAGMANTQVIGEMDPAYANIPGISVFVFSCVGQDNFTLQDLSITTQNFASTSAISGLKEDGMVLRNLRMHNMSPNEAAVIDLARSTNVLMENVIIEDFSTTKQGFMRCEGIFTGRISDCIFRNATSTFVSSDVSGSPLISVCVGSDITVENTIFSNITMMDDDSQAIQFGRPSNTPYTQNYTFNNCLVSNIHCNRRGFLVVGNNYPIMNFNNCTFAGHTGNGEALMVNGIVTISNSIFYNNRSKEIAINPMDFSGLTTTLTLHNNLIRNGYNDIWQGPQSTIHYHDSNISGNPLFAGGTDINDPLYYSLSDSSPCIDNGMIDISGLGLLPYDLAGNWRIWNGRIDMGAFECGSEPWVSSNDPNIPSIQDIAISAFPNPFTAFTNIKVNALNTKERGTNIHSAVVAVYNIKGQLVKNIKLDPNKADAQLTHWDGRDKDNQLCGSGIYFLRLMLNGKNEASKKVTMIR